MDDQQGFPSHLSPADSLMWHIERDPVLRSPILVIGLLDRDPDWDRAVATFERAVEHMPRFRQLVAQPRYGLGAMRWVDDPGFSLHNHLQRVRAPRPGDLRSVLELAERDAAAAFDPARPLWSCTIVEGLEGGRGAFLLRFHHTLTDGVGGLDLARVVFDVTRGGGAAPVLAAADAPPAEPGPPVIERLFDAASAGLDAVAHPMATTSGALRLGRSIVRMLAPVPAALSPLFTERGLDRHLDVLEVPVGDLIAVAKVVGCTVNDVFLAALGGALHDLHQRHGIELPAVRVTMPINLRRDDDAPGGNRFTPVRFVLPIDDPDPMVRARIARAIAHRWRAEPAVNLTAVLAGALDQLPAPVVTRLFGSMLKNIDVDAVDLQGLDADAFVGGARIDRLWAFAPPTGAALSVTLLTHLDTACVSVLSDTAAVPDTELLRTCLDASFDEVRSIAAREKATVTS